MTNWSRIAEAVRTMPEHLAGRGAAPWQPPAVYDFAGNVRVLAYDGSLSATGWVSVERSGSAVHVDGHGTLRVATSLDGYRGTYERSHRMQMQMQEVYLAWRPVRAASWSNFVIAWEAPPVRGHRTESTLIAGLHAYELSQGLGLPVTANHVSRVLAGNGRHDKKEITLAVARYVPEVLDRGWGDQNARDALAVGLTVLWDLKVAADKDIK